MMKVGKKEEYYNPLIMQSIYYKIIKLIGIVTLCDTYDETPQSNNHLSAGIIWKTQSKTGSNYPSFLFGTSQDRETLF